MDRRGFLAGSAAAAATLSTPALAQDYPVRPVTLVNPFPPGGAVDVVGRPFAAVLEPLLKQPVVVETKAGAAGQVGAQFAANAKPDGYTLAQLPLGVFRLPHMVKTSFDPLNDLTWILNIAGYQFGTSVRADSPWKTWDELIAYVKANPGKITFASPGTGTSLHLVMEDLSLRLGLNWVHVPYKGSAEAIVALRGSHVQVQAGSPPWELVEAGQVRPLVMWGNGRNTRIPNVPTLKELYGIVANSPWGIGGPKGMDPKVVKLLHDAFKRVADEPEYLKVLERFGMEPYYMSGEHYTKWARLAYDDEKRVVERLGLNK